LLYPLETLKNLKKLRAVIYNCIQGDLHRQKDAWMHKVAKSTDMSLGRFKTSLYGKISFISMVNYKAGAKLKAEFSKINWNS